MLSLPYDTGVSLHSHTSASEETLSFIHQMGHGLPLIRRVMAHYEDRCQRTTGLKLDFDSAHWRPPLQPRMAYKIEQRQIERLGLLPLVSITDHDTIDAPLLLRQLPSSRHIPVSVEWTAPYGLSYFHLGIHNLPSGDGPAWMQRLAAYSATPTPSELRSILEDLHAQPNVLIVFNHPIWDMYEIGQTAHLRQVRAFLAELGHTMHALELNGLRHARENREVARLAAETGHLLISGGDRHGLEPNANINLTNATTFTEFVHEIRVERQSHILYMEQYAKRWEQRIVNSTLDAITDYPHFVEGWRHWDDRVFHKDQNGVLQPLSSLWLGCEPPMAVRLAIATARLGRHRPIASPLRFVFHGVNDLRPDYETAR
jgi:hypothetical protein